MVPSGWSIGLNPSPFSYPRLINFLYNRGGQLFCPRPTLRLYMCLTGQISVKNPKLELKFFPSRAVCWSLLAYPKRIKLFREHLIQFGLKWGEGLVFKPVRRRIFFRWCHCRRFRWIRVLGVLPDHKGLHRHHTCHYFGRIELKQIIKFFVLEQQDLLLDNHFCRCYVNTLCKKMTLTLMFSTHLAFRN